jgi:LCP family protein required for cell wall assembly
MSANPSPALAAVLSFIFPGLGQIYAGDVRRGLLWALPMLVFIVAVLFLLLGGSAAITQLLTVQKTLALIVFDIAFFLYHVAATIDAYDIARRERGFGYTRRRSTGAAPIVLASLVALAIVMHGLPAVYAADYYAFLVNETDQNGNGGVIPSFAPLTPRPATPTPSVDPNASPTPTLPLESEDVEPTDTPAGSFDPNSTPRPKVCPPISAELAAWDKVSDDGRLNLLLVGSDSRSDEGTGSNSLRTDSMMLLTVDVAQCKAALFSFPRNMQQPAPGSTSRYPSWFHIPVRTNGDVVQDYPGFLFGLWRDAASDPGTYPGSEGIGPECQTDFECERGWAALSGAIQYMTSTKLDAIIAVNLKGFVDIVANLPERGVWLDIPEPLYDDNYFNSRQEKMLIDFDAGCQFLDAEETLAYARSRHQDSDYQRGRRQQFVLQAIRKQLDPLALLPSVPGLLQAASDNLFMSGISDTDIPYLAQAASRVDADRLYRFDFAPARLTRLGSMEGLRDKVVNIFSEPEPEPPRGGGGEPCPPR